MKAKKRKIIILIIVIIIAITFTLITIIKKSKNNTLIYLSNGRLYSLTNKKVKELGRGELSSIKFFNNNQNKYLYKIENDLFLYDKKAKKIIENAKEYEIKKDKIVITDINNNLYLYDKELKEIDDGITTLYKSSDDFIIYSIKQRIYSYNLKKSSKKEICNHCPWIVTGKEDNFFLYTNNQNELIKRAVDSDKEEQIAKNVIVYQANESLKKIVIIDSNKKGYYIDDNKKEDIGEKIKNFQFIYYEKNLVAYTKEDGETYLFINGNSMKLEEKVNVLQIINVDKRIYILTDRGEILEYAPESDKLVIYSNNVFSKIHSTKKGFVYEYYDESNNENILFLVEDGKKEEISKGIVNDSIVVDKKNDIIYYLKKDKENSSILYSYNKRENKIDDGVYKYYVFENKNIYYIKNYKLAYEYGDLYKYNKKVKMVHEKVSDIVGFNNIVER